MAGRAGTGEEVNTLERCQVERLKKIVFDHIPTWPVEPQRVAGMGIVLDQAGMFKARHFQAECLSAGACAKFQCYRCHRFSPKSGQVTALRWLLNCPLYEQKQNIRNHLDVIGGSWTLTFVRVTAREGCGAYLLERVTHRPGGFFRLWVRHKALRVVGGINRLAAG